MGYITKRETGIGTRYYVRYKTPSGKWRQESAGKLKKNAEALLTRIDSEISNGTYGKERDITFAEYAAIFLDNHRSRVKASTYDDYQGVIKVHLLPTLGQVNLRDINGAKCKTLIQAEYNKGYSPRTVNKCVMVLKLMLKEAAVDERIERNPAEHLRRVKVEHEEMDFLQPEEVERLLAACDPDFYPLVATSVLTGMRQGEQLALRWSDIDFEHSVIYVRRSLHQKHGITSTKTIRSARAVTMTPELVNILREHKRNSLDDLVFPGKDGGYIAASNMVRDRFFVTLERAGLRRVRWHDLRHSYASLMISGGANIKFVSQQLGHTSTRTTWDIYAHLLPEPGQEAGRKLDALIFNGKVAHFPVKKSAKAEK